MSRKGRKNGCNVPAEQRAWSSKINLKKPQPNTVDGGGNGSPKKVKIGKNRKNTSHPKNNVSRKHQTPAIVNESSIDQMNYQLQRAIDEQQYMKKVHFDQMLQFLLTDPNYFNQQHLYQLESLLTQQYYKQQQQQRAIDQLRYQMLESLITQQLSNWINDIDPRK